MQLSQFPNAGLYAASSFSPCGRRWREAPDEGFSPRTRLVETYPSSASASLRHLLPQGEKGNSVSILIQHPPAVGTVERECRHVDFKPLAAGVDHLVAPGHE